MAAKPNTVAIVQARMGSSRLPGKSLLPISGQPLLWHVIHRLRAVRRIDVIVLATTTQPQDDAIANWAAANGISCVRGSEFDVLGRFAQAADETRADIIVRVNADSPLIDPAFVDAMLAALIAGDADFVMLARGAIAAHDGVDVMSRAALDLMLREARQDPIAREHVTAWLKLNRDRIKVADMTPDPSYAFEGARLSVDTPDDVRFIEAVHERLAVQAGEASLTDLLGLLRRDPELLAINGHVRQKSPNARSATVVIRCDGGTALGLGHVKRCIALAEAMRDRQSFGVRFAMIGEDKAVGLVEAAGFSVERKGSESEAVWIERLGRNYPGSALVLDIRTDLDADAVFGLRAAFPLIVTLDDGGPRRLAGHLAVYAPLPQTRSLAWPGGDVDICIGWAWTVLGSKPWRAPRPLDSGRATLRVLVSMGGSDPHGLSLRAVRAVAAAGRRVTPVVVVGPATRFPEALADACQAAAPDADIRIAPDSLTPVAAECDLAVVAFGVSAYECAHVGTPALYLGLTPDHALSAQGFEDAGFGVNMGLAATLQERRLTDALSGLVADPEKRRAMAAAGRLAIDGLGSERLAAEIGKRLAAEKSVSFARAG